MLAKNSSSSNANCSLLHSFPGRQASVSKAGADWESKLRPRRPGTVIAYTPGNFRSSAGSVLYTGAYAPSSSSS